MKKLLTLLVFITINSLTGQKGVIKGIVMDKQSENPLMGATVQLLGQETSVGVITDFDGRFTLTDVPIGRQVIQISYLGYETSTLPNIEVTTGKDVFLKVQLLENFNALEEVVVTSNTNKDRARNELATVSARQFGLQEATRFSGGRGDIGRLAANFAGVSSPDDSRNDIVIRGNSPSGLLWRIEGIPIPNPNHFAAFGTTGGPVSAVNSNMLQNSDFFTSAFPAEYGNAVGGVFDLGFRTGNTDDYEYTLQVGAFTGVEATAEGPLGTKNGSFLVAARYSFVGLVGAGAGGGSAATPNYADVSFNLDLGKSKIGRLSLFGIVGTSNIDFIGDELDDGDLFADQDEDLFVKSGFNVVGLKHRIKTGENSYLKTVLATSTSGNEFVIDEFFETTPTTEKERSIEVDNSESRLSASTLFNAKLSSKTTLRTGVLWENYNVKTFLTSRDDPDADGDGLPEYVTYRDADDRFNLLQPFVQGKFRLTEKLTLNTGLHLLHSDLSNQTVIEPRGGLNYAFNDNQSLSFGYGMHNQPVPLPLLFLNEFTANGPVQSNRNLEFVRSQHFVLGYDVKLAQSWRMKLEAYYQAIDNAAVDPFTSGYSSLTEGADFAFTVDNVGLLNQGTGYNQGLELTLEKFYDKGWYGLFTASVFDSKYTGSDGIERNSPFNNGYVLNFLTGREFNVGKSNRTKLFFDTRASFAGGRYYTDIDLEASAAAGEAVYREDNPFSEKFDDYFRWDVKFGFKLNSKEKKVAHHFYLDLQNVLNRKNIFSLDYNEATNQLDETYQVGFFPDFGYKFQF